MPIDLVASWLESIIAHQKFGVLTIDNMTISSYCKEWFALRRVLTNCYMVLNETGLISIAD